MRLHLPARSALLIAAVLLAAFTTALATPDVARSLSWPAAYLPAVHRGAPYQPPPSATPARTPSTVPASAEPPTVEPATPGPPETSTPPHPETTAVPVVVMSGPVDPAVWTVDAYTIQKVAIEGDRLAVTVRHGGGCRTHDFHLVGSRLFMESNPVQSDLLLTHDGHGDLCRALVIAELVLDLGPLKRTYQHAYPNAPGQIILRLRDWTEPVRYEF